MSGFPKIATRMLKNLVICIPDPVDNKASMANRELMYL
jgi:hypothetical protein